MYSKWVRKLKFIDSETAEDSESKPFTFLTNFKKSRFNEFTDCCALFYHWYPEQEGKVEFGICEEAFGPDAKAFDYVLDEPQQGLASYYAFYVWHADTRDADCSDFWTIFDTGQPSSTLIKEVLEGLHTTGKVIELSVTEMTEIRSCIERRVTAFGTFERLHWLPREVQRRSSNGSKPVTCFIKEENVPKLYKELQLID